MRSITAQGMSLSPAGEVPEGWTFSSPRDLSGMVLDTNPHSVIFELS